MRYVAAYLLAALAGTEPSLKEIEKILNSVGIECDKDKANKVINELKGKDLATLIKDGQAKLASVPSGGGAAAAAPAAGGKKDEPKKEEKKEEKKKEEKKKEESEDEDMGGFGLFD